MKKYIKELIPYVVILVVVVLIRTFLVTPVIVSGESMVPTLKDGNLMILNKRAKLKRFDIVVIDTGKEEIIKRVIALPGETISYKNNTLYINGKKVEEKYSYGITDDFESVKLKKDEYFVMGDNRQNSLDSRYFGPFKKKYIRGKTNVIFLPFDRMGKVK